MGDSHSGKLRADFPYLKKRKHVPCFYLNNDRSVSAKELLADSCPTEI